MMSDKFQVSALWAIFHSGIRILSSGYVLVFQLKRFRLTWLLGETKARLLVAQSSQPGKAVDQGWRTGHRTKTCNWMKFQINRQEITNLFWWKVGCLLEQTLNKLLRRAMRNLEPLFQDLLLKKLNSNRCDDSTLGVSIEITGQDRHPGRRLYRWWISWWKWQLMEESKAWASGRVGSHQSEVW